MNHLQFGDHVMVCCHESPHNFKTGMVCSIDIYGCIKVRLEDTQSVIKCKREELKLLSKRFNTTHYMDQNPSFIQYLQRKYQMKSSMLEKSLKIEELKQLINMSLDMRDHAWFMELSERLNALRRIR